MQVSRLGAASFSASDGLTSPLIWSRAAKPWSGSSGSWTRRSRSWRRRREGPYDRPWPQRSPRNDTDLTSPFQQSLRENVHHCHLRRFTVPPPPPPVLVLVCRHVSFFLYYSKLQRSNTSIWPSTGTPVEQHKGIPKGISFPLEGHWGCREGVGTFRGSSSSSSI